MSAEYKSFSIPVERATKLKTDTGSERRNLREFIGYVTNVSSGSERPVLTTASVGTPPQLLSGNQGGSGMFIDTGNAYTAIGAIGCDCNVKYVRTNGYNSTASSTY